MLDIKAYVISLEQNADPLELGSDVLDAIKRWNQRGVQSYLYFSSTSPEQVLPLIDGYFDRHLGPKTDRTSYLRIVEQIALTPTQICFISENPKEIDEASNVGYRTLLRLRDGAGLPDGFAKERSISNFTSL